MANREQSDPADETFPGPGPLRTDETKRGIHPVEQMVDAAIDRLAREHEASRDTARPNSDTSAGPGHALTLAPVDGPPAALMTSGSARRARGRLRWKGLEVSDEFRRYADRVARGEDLPPFQGSILAEPDPAFPWDPNEQRHAQGRALKRQFGLWTGVALFLGLCVWVLVVQVGNQTDPAQKAAESPLATVVLGNQPVVAPPLDVAAADPRAATAAQAEDTETSAATADQGTTALASLQERTAAPSVPAAPAPAASAPRAVAASSNPSAASAVAPASAAGAIVTMRSTAAAPPASKANVLEITRTPPGALDVAASSSDRVPGAGSTSTAGAAGGVAAASPGTATASPIAASPIAASPAPAASAPADPKKEPGREASTMGPLLVEKPSF